MEGWGGLRASVNALRPLLFHPAVEAVVVHQYTVEDASMHHDLGDHNDVNFIMGGSAWYEAEYRRLRDELLRVTRAQRLCIAATEWHVAGAFCRGVFTLGRAPVIALGLADVYIMYACLGIEYACQHTALYFPPADGDGERDRLVEPHYNPFVADGNGVAPTPSWLVTRLFASHVRARTVVLSGSGEPEHEIARVALAGTEVAIKPLSAVAFADATGDELTVVALHRDQTAATRLQVGLPGDSTGRASSWEVVSATGYCPRGDITADACDVEGGLTFVDLSGSATVTAGRSGSVLVLDLPSQSVVGVVCRRVA